MNRHVWLLLLALTNPITTQPDPTGAKQPGSGTPPPTSTNPQDGPGTVVPPTTITNPNLPPVDPKGSPTGVTPPPNFDRRSPDTTVDTLDYESDSAFVKWLLKIAQSVNEAEQKLRQQQIEKLGNDAANRLADRLTTEIVTLAGDKLDKAGEVKYLKAMVDLGKLAKENLAPAERIEIFLNLS